MQAPFVGSKQTPPPNKPPAWVRSPRHQPKQKMKTSDKKLYNALAYFVIFGKQLKNTLEELNFAIQKSEEILIAHNFKPSTRSKK